MFHSFNQISNNFYREQNAKGIDESKPATRLCDFENDNVDYYADESTEKNEKASETAETVRLEIGVESVVMAYICELKPKLGMLNLTRCVERGVPPGPLLGKLKNGEDVTLPDGTIVYANDVRDPDDPGPVFLGMLYKPFIALSPFLNSSICSIRCA